MSIDSSQMEWCAAYRSQIRSSDPVAYHSRLEHSDLLQCNDQIISNSQSPHFLHLLQHATLSIAIIQSQGNPRRLLNLHVETQWHIDVECLSISLLFAALKWNELSDIHSEYIPTIRRFRSSRFPSLIRSAICSQNAGAIGSGLLNFCSKYRKFFKVSDDVFSLRFCPNTRSVPLSMCCPRCCWGSIRERNTNCKTV